MAMNPSPRRERPAPTPVSENETARAERLARERQQIEEARASVAAGRVVSERAFNAWVDSLGTEHELPVPQSR
jgi:predicted transcriptional regulator